MSLDQSIVTIAVALIAAGGGFLVERVRQKREMGKEASGALASVTTARLADEAQKRKEIDEAARDIREFLRKQVGDLNETVDRIEATQFSERQKWNALFISLSTRNIELELQNKRDKMHIEELVEEAKAVDDQVKMFRTRIAVCESDALAMSARLDQCRRECEALRHENAVIK